MKKYKLKELSIDIIDGKEKLLIDCDEDGFVDILDLKDILEDDTITVINKEMVERAWNIFSEWSAFIGIVKVVKDLGTGKMNYFSPIYIDEVIDEELDEIFMKDLHDEYIEKNKNNKRRLDILKEEL